MMSDMGKPLESWDAAPSEASILSRGGDACIVAECNSSRRRCFRRPAPQARLVAACDGFPFRRQFHETGGSMKTFLGGAAAAVLCGILAGAARADEPPKPNVLFKKTQ